MMIFFILKGFKKNEVFYDRRPVDKTQHFLAYSQICICFIQISDV